MDTITAAVMDEHVEEKQAKAISITENLMRRQLAGRELTDGITYLYKHYGNIKAVSEATGLPYDKVREHVHYLRLIPKLKKMVDDNKIDIRVALRAQDAASHGLSEEPQPEIAINLAKEMAKMPDIQRKKLVEERKKNPEKPVDDLIEEAKGSAKVTQMTITITQDTASAITRYAQENNRSKDEAAVDLIEEALKGWDPSEEE